MVSDQVKIHKFLVNMTIHIQKNKVFILEFFIVNYITFSLFLNSLYYINKKK